jgi:hypothetical protein
MPQGDLEHAAIDAVKRLGFVRLSTLRGDSQRVEHIALHICGKFLEDFVRGFDPGDRSRISLF